MNQKTDNNNSSNKNNSNRRRRNNNKRRHHNNNNSNNNKNRSNRNRRPKSLTPARIQQKYDNLLEQHVIARRKYYEMHGRAQGKQLQRLEGNFYDTMKAIVDFQSGLKDWQRDVLEKKINMYPEDKLITDKYQEQSERVDFVGDFEDPHLLDTQKNADYSEDTEESSGSMDDYYSYKGIEPRKEIASDASDKKHVRN
jgi:DNA-binding transcriptional MocR family regulator